MLLVEKVVRSSIVPRAFLVEPHVLNPEKIVSLDANIIAIVVALDFLVESISSYRGSPSEYRVMGERALCISALLDCAPNRFDRFDTDPWLYFVTHIELDKKKHHPKFSLAFEALVRDSL